MGFSRTRIDLVLVHFRIPLLAVLMANTNQESEVDFSNKLPQSPVEVKNLFSKTKRKIQPSSLTTHPPPPPPPAPEIENNSLFKGDEGWEREFQKLNKYLEGHGLRILSVDSDGSCLFSSFAVQLLGTTSESLRNEAVDFMLANSEDFAPFVDLDAYPQGFEDYCRRMRMSTTWGSQLEIQALSECKKVNVYIFQTDGKATIKMVNFDESTAPCVTVSYHDGQHYNAVLPLADQEVAAQPTTARSLENLFESKKVDHLKSYVDDNSSRIPRARKKGGLFN